MPSRNNHITPSDIEPGRMKREPSMAGPIHDEMPSTLLHQSDHGTTLARQKLSKNRQSKTQQAKIVESLDHAPRGMEGRKHSRNTINMDILAQAEKKGLKFNDIGDRFNELERLRQLDVIRQMPINIPMKRRLRDKLFESQRDVEESGCDAYCYARRLACFRCRLKTSLCCNEFKEYMTLWRKDFIRIEGNFGSGVLTYFRFLKWLFKLNVLIFFLVLLFILIPQVAFTDFVSYTVAVLGVGAINTTITESNCSDLYTVEVNSDALSLVLDFLGGTGWMEKTAMFIGFYSDKEMTVLFGDGNFKYNMPLAYVVVIVIIFLISLIAVISETSAGYKERLFSETSAYRQYCNKVFGGWDYTFDSEKHAELRHKSIHRDFYGTMEEERREAVRSNRTCSQTCKVVTIRLLFTIIILGLLGGAGYLIYYTTQMTIQLTTSADFYTYHSVVQFLIEYMTSFTITLLNALMPTIFKFLVRFEGYSPSMEVNITLARTVFVKFASLAVLLSTIYINIVCKPKDECNVGTGECIAIRCWETYAGQEIYKLVLTDFYVMVLVTILVEFPRRLIVEKCICKLTKIIGRQTFDIPKNVLDLIYSQTLLWLGIFFSPLIIAMCVLKLLLLFYLKELTAIFNYVPSAKPYKASDSHAFFMVVLLLAYMICIIPIFYCITMIQPSAGCGPFRNYDHMYDILTITMDTFPPLIKGIISFLSSNSIIIGFIVVLCMVIYYMAAVLAGYKSMLGIMKEQLQMEGQDKQFLMTKIANLNQNTPEKAALPEMTPVTEEPEEKKEMPLSYISRETPPNVPMD